MLGAAGFLLSLASTGAPAVDLTTSGNGDGIQGSESPVLIELCMILRRQLRFGIRQTSVAFNALAESLDTCT